MTWKTKYRTDRCNHHDLLYEEPHTKRGSIDKAYSFLVRILSETNKIAICKVVDEIEAFADIHKVKIDNKEQLTLGKSWLKSFEQAF
ncbi:MAG: hypothetical protein WA667_28625 [Candidatus Nitrosopolaris sp.]